MFRKRNARFAALCLSALVIAHGAHASDEVVQVSVGLGAPPDPGEMGKRTLAGTDDNGNAVRDDVERFILAKYHSRPKTLRAFANVAISLQQAINSTSNEESAHAHSMLIRSSECYLARGDERKGDANGWAKMVSIILNTPARTAAAEAHAARIADMNFVRRIEPTWDAYCDVRADKVTE
jgi:hypothetical protein